MEFSVLCDCLKRNGFDTKPLTAAKRAGCVQDYAKLHADLFAMIEDAAIKGINSGFAHGLKGKINSMISLASDISKERSTMQYKKYQPKVDKITAKTEKILNKSDVLTVKDELIQRIDAYIKGTRAHMAECENESRKYILQQGVSKLEELKGAVGNVSIFVGKEANELGSAIVKELLVWSSDVSTSMYDDASLGSLGDAIATAAKWGKVKNAPRKASPDLSGIEFDENDKSDGLTAAGLVVATGGRAKIFRDNLDNYKKKIEKRYSTEADERELQNKKDEKERLSAQIAEIRSRFQNGEIPKDEALDLIEPLDSDMQFIEDDIIDLNEHIVETKEQGSMYKAHLRLLDRIMRVVDKYEGEFEKLAMVYDVIDFNALNAVMRGTADKEEINTVDLFAEIEQIITDVEREGIAAFSERTRETREKHREQRAAQKHERRERQRDPQSNSRLNALLGEEEEAPIQNAPENVAPERVRTDRSRLSSLLEEN